jgi:ribonuclease J
VNIRSIFSQIKGRIIIATFASNVYRVQQIIEASVANDRKVIVFGRSMERTLAVGQQLGYIKAPKGTIISAKEFPHLPPEKITILSTGSQGEPLAALSRIAQGTHRQIKLVPGDTIVFSSSAIPGNQESINGTINKLYKAGANVIINSPLTDTHTSGHASQDELKLMLVLTKPKYFMPIHGEYTMQAKHRELAMQTGVPGENCFLLENGHVLTLTKNGAYAKEYVKAGDIFIDTNSKVIDGTIIKERKLLADDGMVSAVFSIKDNNQINAPAIVSRGFIYMKQSEELISVIQKKAEETMNKYLLTHKVPNFTSVKGFISNELSNYIYELTERKPIIIPIIMEVN